MTTPCELCEEFTGGGRTYFGNIENRVLYSTHNFIVVPTIGHFLEGYLLICSKEHYPATSYLPTPMFEELEEVIEKTKGAVQSVYNSPTILFEHGSKQDKSPGTGACIDHMHIHLVPFPKFPPTSLTTPQEVQEYRELARFKDENYYFCEDHEKKRVFNPPKDPCGGYLRRALFKASCNIRSINLPSNANSDYLVYPGESLFRKTLTKLKNKF